MASRPSLADRRSIALLWAELGIAAEAVKARRLPLYTEAKRLTPVGLGTDGRDKLLVPGAATAWRAMQQAAAGQGVELQMVSAFRSYAFQASLIRNKLAKGRAIDEILTVNAPPGCSEHHSGRAIDIGTSGCPPLEEDFERTIAFDWLRLKAADYGYVLTYPRDNAEGYLYEPWHWCWQATISS